MAFGIGIALVAAAGGLLATYYPIEPNVAVNFIVLMFVAVVLGGLEAGEHVVTAGQYRLAPGVKVEMPSAAAPPVTTP